jgi:hypothetical protein
MTAEVGSQFRFCVTNKRRGWLIVGCVPVEKGCERADQAVAEEEERGSGKSGGQGEKLGEEEERGAREVVKGSAGWRWRCRRGRTWVIRLGADGGGCRLRRGGITRRGWCFGGRWRWREYDLWRMGRGLSTNRRLWWSMWGMYWRVVYRLDGVNGTLVYMDYKKGST